MHIRLRSDLEALVTEKVARGEYASADEVIAVAPRMLEKYEEKRAELQRAIDESVADAAAGRVSEGPFSDLIGEFEAELEAERRR